jgi:phage gpG-like protein
MAKSLRIEIDCDAKKTLARLEAMSTRSKNFTPVFNEARQMLERANTENFTTGGLPVGGWKPRKGTYAWPPLIKSGKLFNSLANLRGNPNVVTPLFAEFGTKVEYAKFHQYGTSKMPARKIVFDPPGFSRELSEKAARFVTRGRMS